MRRQSRVSLTRLRLARLARGWNVGHVYCETGIPTSFISSAEIRKSLVVPFKQKLFAEMYNLPVEFLFDERGYAREIHVKEIIRAAGA